MAKVVKLATEAAPLVKGIFKKKKKKQENQSYKPDFPYHDPILLEMAKEASEKAGKNARVAPQLLFTGIMFVLVDAVENGKIILQLNEVED